jgi:outer membrane receptor for ferric coprogen and ferric-rhodotorulic acid
VAGSWAGSGLVTVVGSPPERLVCRVSYSTADRAHLHLSLRCATDSLNLQIGSDIERQGETLSGTWSEANTGISGDVTGRVGASSLQVTIAGLGTTASMRMTLNGATQSISLVSEGQLTARATVTLRRA